MYHLSIVKHFWHLKCLKHRYRTSKDKMLSLESRTRNWVLVDLTRDDEHQMKIIWKFSALGIENDNISPPTHAYSFVFWLVIDFELKVHVFIFILSTESTWSAQTSCNIISWCMVCTDSGELWAFVPGWTVSCPSYFYTVISQLVDMLHSANNNLCPHAVGVLLSWMHSALSCLLPIKDSTWWFCIFSNIWIVIQLCNYCDNWCLTMHHDCIEDPVCFLP